MPALLGFLACEKVIFEQETNKVSIIGVLHDVFIPVIRSVPVPVNTFAPLVWAAFTMWYWRPEDTLNIYEQVITLVGETGETLIQSNPLRFTMEPNKRVMRLVSHFANIPIYKPAQCTLKLFIRTLGPLPPPNPLIPWQEMMSYPIGLHHTYL